MDETNLPSTQPKGRGFSARIEVILSTLADSLLAQRTGEQRGVHTDVEFLLGIDHVLPKLSYTSWIGGLPFHQILHHRVLDQQAKSAGVVVKTVKQPLHHRLPEIEVAFACEGIQSLSAYWSYVSSVGFGN